MDSQPAGSTETWDIARLLKWTANYFAQRDLDEPRLSAEILLATALGCRRIELYTRFDQIPTSDQLDSFRSLVKKAANHTPIAYLVGEKEFFSLSFSVSPAVLIPRPETELLVQQAIEFVRQSGNSAPRILDVGTGSGCIAVAIATQLPQSTIVATDVCAEALKIATTNAQRYGMGDRIEFAQADRLSLPGSLRPEGGFDLIVSNPPYIAADEMASLPANVRDFEPRPALTDEDDGLSFFRDLAQDGQPLLASGGAVMVEIADGQAEAVARVFGEQGTWRPAGRWRDVGGGQIRVLAFYGT